METDGKKQYKLTKEWEVSMKPEGYQPSEREVARAEEMMTDVEEGLSQRRARYDALWDKETEKTRVDAEESSHTNYIGSPEKAEERGEKTVGVELTTEVRVSVKSLLMDPDTGIDNATWHARKRMRVDFIREMNEQHPDIVDDSRIWQQNNNLLWSMVRLAEKGTVEYEKESELYNVERAKQLLEENRQIEGKYGIQSGNEVILKIFEELGDKID